MKITILLKEIIMSINDNISDFLKRYKDEHHLTLSEMADEFGLARSLLENYINGGGNPRADTLEIIAEKCGASVTEIISAQPPGWERAEIVGRAARVFGDLPPEQRDRAVSLFLALVDILAEGDHA
ncbi:MAG: helix-turn-helix transcriptional regulator [Oscillibacter sp.]|nr:helix-turn-helix transcriptional regulator [Oscillibacter sp.]